MTFGHSILIDLSHVYYTVDDMSQVSKLVQLSHIC